MSNSKIFIDPQVYREIRYIPFQPPPANQPWKRAAHIPYQYHLPEVDGCEEGKWTVGVGLSVYHNGREPCFLFGTKIGGKNRWVTNLPRRFLYLLADNKSGFIDNLTKISLEIANIPNTESNRREFGKCISALPKIGYSISKRTNQIRRAGMIPIIKSTRLSRDRFWNRYIDGTTGWGDG